MFGERIAIALWKLDRWQETSNRISRIRRWILKHHKAYWLKRFTSLQAKIRDLICLNAQILMSGNSKRKLPKVTKQLAKIEREYSRFAGDPHECGKLRQEMMNLRLVCSAKADPDIVREPCPMPPPYVAPPANRPFDAAEFEAQLRAAGVKV